MKQNFSSNVDGDVVAPHNTINSHCNINRLVLKQKDNNERTSANTSFQDLI